MEPSQISRIPVPEIDLVTIGAGEFIIGPGPINTTSGIQKGDPHSLVLSEYKIGRYPVTNAQYLAFVQDTGHWFPLTWDKEYPEEKANHPVSGVMWADAWLFCAWMAYKTDLPYHLPTEAEWEKAATWNPYAVKKQAYPWGDEADKTRCNTIGAGNKGTTPVGFYSPFGDSPYSCVDMIGNVDEWCNSVMEPYPYNASDGREELHRHGRRAMRGGDWYSILGPATGRHAPSDAWAYMWGFRVAVGNLLKGAHKEYHAKLKDAVDKEGSGRQALIDWNPRSAQNIYNRGTWRMNCAELGLDHNLQAEEDLTRALDLALSDKTLINTPLFYVYFNRARVRLFMGKYDLAIADMTEAIVLDPSDLSSYVIRADANCSLNRLEQAQQDLDFVRQRDPKKTLLNSGHAQKVQAQVYANIGQEAQAIALYTEVLHRPMFVPLALPEIHLLRGQVYEKLGQREQSLSDYYHYILWKPDSPEAPVLREKLRQSS